MTELSASIRIVERIAPIAEGTVVPYYVSDRKLRIAIARVNGQLYAFGDLCTCSHPSCSLSGGLLTGQIVMCQCHGSRFDVTTGSVMNGPATRPLSVYEIHETGGEIQIRV